MAKAKRVIGGILFSVALVAILAFLFLLFMEAENVDTVPGTDLVFEIAIAIAVVLGVVALILFLLILSRKKPIEDEEEGEVYFIPSPEDRQGYGAPEPRDPNEPLPPPTDVVVYDLWRVPVVMRSWNLRPDAAGHDGLDVYSFPCNVERGVYTNDYIHVDDHLQLKLRTLLAGPRDIEDFVVREPAPAGAATTSEAPEETWEAADEGWSPDGPERAAEPAPDAGESWERPDRPPRRRGSKDFMSEMEQRFGERQG